MDYRPIMYERISQIISPQKGLSVQEAIESQMALLKEQFPQLPNHLLEGLVIENLIGIEKDRLLDFYYYQVLGERRMPEKDVA